jgi:hypothetical protein
MKKNLFILGFAALAFAACSNDEVVEVNQGNAINFRTFVGGVTRASDITTSNLSSFKAYAIVNGTSNTYFAEDEFTKSSSTFSSASSHYWPSSGALDFYAYAPSTNTQLTGHSSETLGFTVTPSTTISEQVDLVVANTNNKSKDGVYNSTKHYGADGIPLNFRHAESKVVVKFKNGQANMKIDVQAFKIVNVDGEATYTYTTANNTSTDGNNGEPASAGTTLSVSDWSDNTTYTASYTATPDETNQLAPSTTTAVYLQDNGTATTTANEDLSMILIPQTTTAVAAYTGSAVNDGLEANKSYIAVKMIIRNNDSLDDGTGGGTPNTNGTILANCTGDGNWAIWPVAFTWVPGKKYIYTIDLGDGGYWEKEQVAGDSVLDKVLEGAVIKFVNVTVDEWDNSESTVTFP